MVTTLDVPVSEAFSVTKEEITEISNVLDHSKVVSGVPYTPEEHDRQFDELVAFYNAAVPERQAAVPERQKYEYKCKCSVCTRLRRLSDIGTDTGTGPTEYDLFLQGILAYMRENAGRLLSGNLGNIAVELTKFILRRCGYRTVQAAMEAKSTIASPQSTHTRFRFGIGPEKADYFTADGTPDFYGRALTGVYKPLY